MNTETDQKELVKLTGNVHLAYYTQAAEELGINYEIISHGYAVRYENNGKHWFIILAGTPLNNMPSVSLSRRKNLSYRILEKAGIPVAEQRDLKTEEEAIQFFNEKKYIVLKPVQGIGGSGVSVLPRDEVQVVKAFTLAKEVNKASSETDVLGEVFASGVNYRVLVLGDEVIGVVRRIPASIIGDGVNSVQELIKQKNDARREMVLSPIQVDDELFKKLHSQSMDLSSIPAANQEVYVRFNSNLSTGGTTEECAKELHPAFAEIAVNATKALGLTLGGVDLIAEDITDPTKPCVINEVNWNPGLRVHYKADKGEIVKVAVPIMKYMSENM